MTVTNYYSVYGEILGEKTTGGSRIDYLTDALGSVTATLNQSAQVVNTYRYKPYGTQLAKTGTGTDPSFGWIGTRGYRKTGSKFSDEYIRARHYSSITGTWTHFDLNELTRVFNDYTYVRGLPTRWIDPSGKTAVSINATSCQSSSDCCDDADSYYRSMSAYCKGGTWVRCQKPGMPVRTTCDVYLKSIASNPVEKSSVCYQMRTIIRSLSQYCQEGCSGINPYEPKPTPPGQSPDVPQINGLTLCCYNAYSNVPKNCGYRCCSNNLASYQGGLGSCLLYCLTLHEQTHMSSPECTEASGTPDPMPRPIQWPKDSECCPYRKQLLCLIAKATQLGCDFNLADLEYEIPDLKACFTLGNPKCHGGKGGPNIQ